MKELVEDTDQEKALKDFANATAKEKSMVAEVVEKKAQSSKKARLVAKRKSVEVEDRLRGVGLKLAEATSLRPMR